MPQNPGASVHSFPLSTIGSGDSGRISLEGDQVSIAGSVRNATIDGTSGSISIAGRDVTVDARVSARSVNGSAGTLVIRGDKILLTNHSRLLVDAGSVIGGSDPQVRPGTIDIRGYSQPSAKSLQIASPVVSLLNLGGTGRAGALTIHADTLRLDNSRVLAQTFGAGPAGTISLNADTLHLDNSTVIADTLGAGPAGTIWLNAGSVLFEGATPTLQANGSAEGNAGSVWVNATGLVHVEGGGTSPGNSGGIFVLTVGSGGGGQVHITAGRLLIDNGAHISVTSQLGSSGAAGTITIDATEAVRISNEGGGPFILGDFLRGILPVPGFVGVFAGGLGGGSGGPIKIHASTISIVDGGTVISSTFRGGNAGDVSLDGNHVEISGGGGIESSALGTGKGGSITIHAADSIAITGSGSDGLPSRVRAVSLNRGRAGNVTLDAPRVLIDGGAVATTSLDLRDSI